MDTSATHACLINPFIPTVPYAGGMTGHVRLFLLLVTFGIRLTCEVELPLYKEGVVEHFLSCCLEEAAWKVF